MEKSVLFIYKDKIESRRMWAKNRAALISKCWDYCFRHGALQFEIK